MRRAGTGATAAACGGTGCAGLEGDDRHVQLFVSQHDWQHSREMIEALREVTGSLDLQILPDGALPLLASTAVRADTLSLMQGDFARRTGWRVEWQRWRVAAFLAVAALALHIGVRGYDLVRLHAEQSRLDSAIDQAARIALPLPAASLPSNTTTRANSG